MVRLLNQDPRIAVTIERYKHVRVRIEPFYFQPELLFHPIARETNLLFFGELYEMLETRLRRGSVRYIGDKDPYYYEHFELLARRMPGARFVMMFRDLLRVAASYDVRARNPNDIWAETLTHDVAVEHWNKALREMRSFCDAGGDDRLFVAHYERLFAGDFDHARALWRFLDLDLPDDVIRDVDGFRRQWPRRNSRPVDLDPDTIAALERRKDFEHEAWCLQRIASQLEQ